jgi:hypothetical protein
VKLRTSLEKWNEFIAKKESAEGVEPVEEKLVQGQLMKEAQFLAGR